MQAHAKSLIGRPIVSLFHGAVVGVVRKIIVEPSRLQVVLFAAETGRRREELFVRFSDVRDLSIEQLIVDSDASLSRPSELVRYEQLIEEPCLIINYKVRTVSGTRLGRCKDFVFDLVDGRLKKLYISGNVWNYLIKSHHIIDKDDIVRIEDKQIVVRDGLIKELRRVKKAGAVLPAHSA